MFVGLCGFHRRGYSVCDCVCVILRSCVCACSYLAQRYEDAASDFEQARLVDPDNPNLVINYSRLHEIECIVLCAAGEEPL